MYDYVFTKEDEVTYTPYIKAGSKYTEWRTFQMSDHLPMWVEIKIDYSTEYLERKLKENFGIL